MKLPAVLGVAALLLLSVHGVPFEPFERRDGVEIHSTTHIDASPIDADVKAGHGHAVVAPFMNMTGTPEAKHAHGGHHAAPLVELDEAEILTNHSPDTLSYWEYDHQSTLGDGERRYGGLMLIHVALMSIAFFGILPVGIALRSTKHPLHPIAQVAFVGCTVVGCLFSSIYNRLTPNLYEGQSHSSMGYILLLAVLIISASDVLILSHKVISFVRNRFSGTQQPPTRWSISDERENLVAMEEPMDFQAGDEREEAHHTEPERGRRHAHFVDVDIGQDDEKDVDQVTAHAHQIVLPRGHHRGHRSRQNSEHSISSTLHGSDDDDENEEETVFASSPAVASSPSSWTFAHRLPAVHVPTPSKLKKAGETVVYLAEWLFVYMGLAMLFSGGAVYTGRCRENYLNGCLAHIIKGAIFFVYGIMTFCRYLGAWAEIGWSWNRAPAPHHDGRKHGPPPTAEFVECTIVFIYGVTQTYVERMGAAPGSSISAKEVQHVMIAVMFAFAGAVGMALESKKVKELLGAAAMIGTEKDGEDGLEQPVSYTGSFNPFPAIVIGVTGAAMAAHHQRYLFAVQVHALWGNLLVAFAVMRCLTYIFLWLKPPASERSVLPSRPPTEILASFFLSCGGLVFIASTEQVVFAAMRHGRDDIMMILTVVVALTCFVFSWCVLVLAVKGWAARSGQQRLARRQQFHLAETQ